MRIISGSARGRRLLVPDSGKVRPTTDRVREAVFNALGSMGGVRDLGVLDLFAGSGALGLEALSRGASRATFVERDRAHQRDIRSNITSCGFEDVSAVVGRDVESFLSANVERFDVTFADPPYEYDRWSEVLDALPSDLVVLESDRRIDLPPGWRYLRERSYGSTVVGIAESGEFVRSHNLVESSQ